MTADSPDRTAPTPQRVVLVQTAFVGDVVFASPLVHAIRQSYPDAHIAMLVRPDKAEVAACIPGVNEVIGFDKRGAQAGALGLWRTARALRRGKFDLLVTPHRSARTALLAGLSGIPRRIGFRRGLGKMFFRPAVAPPAGVSSGLLQDLYLIESAGIPAAGTRLRLKAPEGKREYVEDFWKRNQLEPGCKLVALCIGSLWPTKRWPAIYFASLAESLRERGYVPLTFGGPFERELAEEINRCARSPLCSCVGNTLGEATALLDRCQMAVGGDSGLTHVARALGLPTVLIYGPTDHRIHSFGERARALTAKVKCRPCHRHGPRRCPERHHDCMRLVSPEQVLDALREIADLQTPVPHAARSSAVDGPSIGLTEA